MRDELALLRDARPDVAELSPELTEATRSRLMSQIALPVGRPKLPRRAVVLVAATALAAAAALVGVTLSDRNGGTAFAAALVRVAETAPRLLVDAPGWHVTRADQFGVGYGEMTFANGERQLELHWERGGNFADGLADPHSGLAQLGTMTVQGVQARLFRYVGTNDFVAVWLYGDYGLQARGIAPDLPTFKTVAGALHEVDVDAWLSAMPDSVVKPEGRRNVVLGMLEGVPLPPRFDLGALLRGDKGTVLDRYQLGAQVSGAVGCAWLDRWMTARRAGDEAGLRQAVGALGSSHHWRVLQEMEAAGDYPRVFWEYADAAAADAPVMGGKPLTVEESYRGALGCPAG
jgi:hypothetical protein